ncbi:ABC transporter substrate-binding protein [soil metagenome]
MTELSLAFSPDSDDIFMFWALLNGKIATGDLTFVVERHDTETLNALADRESADVLALSIARWAEVADRYLLLPHGASVGRGYGPVVVAETPTSLESLRGKRIGVPGLRTTAYAVLRVLLREFEPVVVPIAPYSKSFDAIRTGAVDAALLIHEGRLTYEREGFVLVTDIGADWTKLTGLPLALGGNAIRRGLGDETIARVSELCRASIAWGLAHREELMTALLNEESRSDVVLDRALLDRYLAMYANEDTREMKDDVKLGIAELFKRAHEVGVLSRARIPEFAP